MLCGVGSQSVHLGCEHRWCWALDGCCHTGSTRDPGGEHHCPHARSEQVAVRERERERHWLQPQRTTSQTTRLDVQLPTGQLYNDKHLSFFHATGFTLHFAFLFDFVKKCLDNWQFDQIRSQLVKLSAHFTKCSHYSRSSVHKLINSVWEPDHHLLSSGSVKLTSVNVTVN